MTKHGLHNHRLYSMWRGIKQRCYNKNCKCFDRYGGRGISLCDGWLTNFKVFYDYVISLPNYGEVGMTLDRIDNNGNYEPGNLRWANMHMQTANRNIQKRSKTGYIGVTLDKGRYRWKLTVNKKRHVRHGFDSAKNAADDRTKFIIENNLLEYLMT